MSSTTLAFEKKALTKLVGRPTHATVTKLYSEVYANASSIDCSGGGGEHGHLGLVMSPEEYAEIQGTVAFTATAHPGEQPAYAAGANGPVIAAEDRAYDKRLSAHEKTMRVQAELKQQVIEAVEEKYLQLLKHKLHGYKLSTIRTMLEHLQSTYGEVTSADHAANREKLTAEWNPDNDLEDLWTRIKEIQEFAGNGEEKISD